MYCLQVQLDCRSCFQGRRWRLLCIHACPPGETRMCSQGRINGMVWYGSCLPLVLQDGVMGLKDPQQIR